jgi:hypothetical protein
MRIILVLFFASYLQTLSAAEIRAVASGNWSDKSTWSCNCIPGKSDNILIPAGIKVTSAEKILLNFGPKIIIRIDGTLELLHSDMYSDAEDFIEIGSAGKILADHAGAVLYSGTLPFFVSGKFPITGPATIFAGTVPASSVFFKAEQTTPDVLLTWGCPEGTEGYIFTLQQSVDGIHFDTLTQLSVSNSKQCVNCFYKDKHSLNGMVYYRLSQSNEEQNQFATTIALERERNRKRTF